MITNIRPACLVVVAVALLIAARSVQAAQAGPDRVGYQLLERLVAAVAVAARPASGAADISPELLGLARDLKAAHAAKRVDDLFALRFGRLLSAVRQAVLADRPSRRSASHVLEPHRARRVDQAHQPRV